MIHFSVSNVSYFGADFAKLKELPLEIGIEIFYEWSGRRYYEYALRDMRRASSGKFSIHAPFQYIDFSAPCDEGELFDYLMEPFDMYHRFGASGYVIHTDAPTKQPYSAHEAGERRRRVEDRLCRFDAIARREGVNLLVENLCVGAAGHHLFSEAQYLQLLLDHPQLDVLIDVGHAHAQRFDLKNILGALGTRIKAYHLHDNDGLRDSHLPLFKGSFPWQDFARCVNAHTPDADMVLEYASPDGIPGFLRDIEAFKALLAKTRPV